MKRTLLVLAVALCAAATAPAQEWAKARVQKSPRHLEWVSVKHDRREVKCFIGFPERSDQAPAVLIIHEIFGHTDWVQSVVDEFAAAGYIAIAPDFLSGMAPGGGGSAELGSSVGRVINTIPLAQLEADLDAAAAYVRKEPSCNGKLVVAGFCWGGTKAFAYAAHQPDLSAALVFYGAAPDAAAMAQIHCPVYGFYGGNDARISAAVPQVTTAMKAAGKHYEPIVYDGAGHGFMRAGEDPENRNGANAKARDEAWQRVKAILSKL
jgi:carboxymethylenebutenolidase